MIIINKIKKNSKQILKKCKFKIKFRINNKKKKIKNSRNKKTTTLMIMKNSLIKIVIT